MNNFSKQQLMFLEKNKEKKISFFDNLFLLNENNYIAIYNPYSYKKPLIIHRFFFIFLKKYLKKNFTLGTILEIIKNKKLKKIIINLLIKLNYHHLISLNGEKNHLHINKKNNFNQRLIFWVDTTNQCNFRCSYCYIERTKKFINPFIFKDLLKKIGNIINVNYKRNYKKIVFVLAGGEPLLYFNNLVKIVNIIKEFEENNKSKLKIETYVITNGSLLDIKKIKFFKKNNIKLGISFDGLGHYHNLTRKFISGKNTFSYVLKSIKLASREKILLNTITTVTPQNIFHLPKLVDFFLKNKINFELQFYKKTNRNCLEKINKFSNKEINSYLKLIDKIYKYYLNKKKEINFSLEGSGIPSILSKYGCSAGFNYFTITSDCEIKFCPSSDISIPYDKYDNFFKEIIEKNKKIVFYSVENNPFCKKCLWKYLCKGGCRLELFNLKRINKKPLICNFYKKVIPYLISLEVKSIIEKNDDKSGKMFF